MNLKTCRAPAGAWIETRVYGSVRRAPAGAWIETWHERPRTELASRAPAGAWIETADLSQTPVLVERSRPPRARGLKPLACTRLAARWTAYMSRARGRVDETEDPSLAPRGLKIFVARGRVVETALYLSRAPRARGLKPGIRPHRGRAPAGAWIETPSRNVAPPRARGLKHLLSLKRRVAPPAGAWIETVSWIDRCRAPRGRVD